MSYRRIYVPLSSFSAKLVLPRLTFRERALSNWRGNLLVLNEGSEPAPCTLLTLEFLRSLSYIEVYRLWRELRSGWVDDRNLKLKHLLVD